MRSAGAKSQWDATIMIEAPGCYIEKIKYRLKYFIINTLYDL
jgi:hypothetical protein